MQPLARHSHTKYATHCTEIKAFFPFCDRLLSERARHLARLAQIDKVLGNETSAGQPVKETRIPVSAPVSGVEKPKRKMSKAARAKIAAAQKARWAKAKLGNQPKAVEAAPAPAAATPPAPVASPAEKPKTKVKKAT